MNMSTLDKVHTSGPLLYSDMINFMIFFYVYCSEIFRAKADHYDSTLVANFPIYAIIGKKV